MLVTMRSFFILALFCLVGWSNSQNCPAKYKRFTPQHTFCLPPNPTCQISRTGVSQKDIEVILRAHNQFRSKVAMGNEHGAIGGSLPQAADMMQMEWDDELAAVAQKWTENCYFDHDCKECKAVENFAVGQNLALEDHNPSNEPSWADRIAGLYNEVKDYHKSWLGNFQSHPGPMTGHFTQVIWSKSWRVGCGYSYYKQGGVFYNYYACNYGPGGNVRSQPVYKPGQPCSACPTNTQCSNSFPGLCKMNNPNTAPIYRLNQQNLLFYCGSSSSDPDCKSVTSGDGSWTTVNSVGGNYNSIVLRGGQSATVTYTTPIKPNASRFCLRLTYRKGPLDASSRDASRLEANYKMDYGSAGPMVLNPGTTTFSDLSIDLTWGEKTALSFTFSVPRGAGQHVLDIRKIVGFDGACASRKD